MSQTSTRLVHLTTLNLSSFVTQHRQQATTPEEAVEEQDGAQRKGDENGRHGGGERVAEPEKRVGNDEAQQGHRAATKELRDHRLTENAHEHENAASHYSGERERKDDLAERLPGGTA